ncbi:hypothetical protein Z043_117236, partial [Scleropages formosus]
MKKAILIIFFFLLAFGIWYWWPSLSKLPANFSGTTLPGPAFPQLLTTISRRVMELLSSQAESSDATVQQPKIEDVLQSLEKKLLDRLAEEKERADMYRRKLETLEEKCAGVATVE